MRLVSLFSITGNTSELYNNVAGALRSQPKVPVRQRGILHVGLGYLSIFKLSQQETQKTVSGGADILKGNTMGIKGLSSFDSIQRKMSAIVIAVTTLIAFSFGTLNYFAQKSALMEDLDHLGELITIQLSRNLAAPLYDLEDEKIKDVIKSVMYEDQVFGVILKEEGSDAVYAGVMRDAQGAVVEAKEEIGGGHIIRSADILQEETRLGGVTVHISTRVMDGKIRESLIGMVVAAVVINLMLFLALFVSMNRIIVAPINRVTKGLIDINAGEGDLTMRLPVGSADEVGRLAAEFNTFLTQLKEMIGNISGNADTLANASKTLLDLSGLMTKEAGEMKTKSDSASSASGTMTDNMGSVATTMEQSAGSVNMVATAIEEMTATVNEIAKSSEAARGITREAVSQAQQASSKMTELGQAADEISKVTETINEISEQTNLLALNATIEAARAGDAGKGFAVVASEIKELANQTAGATQDIKTRIDGIQQSTAATVDEIDGISGVIDRIDEIVSTIAAAVEEQSATTKEISQNVAQVSTGIQGVSRNVTQTSDITRGIAGDISELNKTSEGISDIGTKVNISSEELTRLAGQLKEMVGKFKV